MNISTSDIIIWIGLINDIQFFERLVYDIFLQYGYLLLHVNGSDISCLVYIVQQ